VAGLQTLQCPNCGATVVFNPSVLAKTCEFCGSEFATPVPESYVDMQRGSFVLPFRVDKPGATELFRSWLEKGMFKPGDLLQNLQSKGYEGMYVPHWSFIVDVRTNWHGQYSETRYRRVSKTRTNAQGNTERYEVDEPYTVWHPRSGVHNGHYFDHIAASSEIAQRETDMILPFDFADSRPWAEDYIAGFKAEMPAKPEDVAWRECLGRVEAQEKSACGALIERLDSASSEVLSRSSQLSYLPTWIFAYSYKGKQYRALVNGQSGEVRGAKPISAGKVAAAVVVAVVVLAVVVGLVLLLARH